MVGFLSLLCGVIWGAVSDRWGRNVGLTGVFLGHASSYALFAVVDGIPGYVISGILFGLTAWSVPAIVSAALGDQLGSRLAPAALGFVTLFFGIGQAAGPYIAGVFAESLESFAPTFLLASGVALLGALASALLRTGPKGASSTS
jgi:MFS family permease